LPDNGEIDAVFHAELPSLAIVTSCKLSCVRLREQTMVIKRGEQIIESAQEARQAERGPTVRNVLVASLSLVIVVFVIVWLVFFQP